MSTFVYEPFFTPSDVGRLFEQALATRNNDAQNHGPNSLVRKSLKPRLDLHEDPQANTITATFELPGLKKEDVNIDIHNNRLVVSGESKSAENRDENGYAIRERRYGQFSRTIQLPEGVKEDEIKASMAEGVLTVVFPRSAPESTPKKITIT